MFFFWGVFCAEESSTTLKVGSYILIGIGSLSMLMGFLGCIGAINEIRCLLGLVSQYRCVTPCTYLISSDKKFVCPLFRKTAQCDTIDPSRGFGLIGDRTNHNAEIMRPTPCCYSPFCPTKDYFSSILPEFYWT